MGVPRLHAKGCTAAKAKEISLSIGGLVGRRPNSIDYGELLTYKVIAIE
jgi:hypothetical protein